MSNVQWFIIWNIVILHFYVQCAMFHYFEVIMSIGIFHELIAQYSMLGGFTEKVIHVSFCKFDADQATRI